MGDGEGGDVEADDGGGGARVRRGGGGEEGGGAGLGEGFDVLAGAAARDEDATGDGGGGEIPVKLRDSIFAATPADSRVIAREVQCSPGVSPPPIWVDSDSPLLVRLGSLASVGA